MSRYVQCPCWFQNLLKLNMQGQLLIKLIYCCRLRPLRHFTLLKCTKIYNARAAAFALVTVAVVVFRHERLPQISNPV